MIETLQIKRFKSILELSIACKKINVFIGEPNSGKSNILEALGILSFIGYSGFGYDAKHFVRFERTSNLFYDEGLEYPFEIVSDAIALKFGFKKGGFQGVCSIARDQSGSVLSGDYANVQPSTLYEREREIAAQFKFYRFAPRETYPRPESEFLLPPSGENLVSVLLGNKGLRTAVNDLFSPTRLRLGIRPHEGKLEAVKRVEDVIISYPYSVVSDTLQRLTFYLAAILSNKQSVLVFEEPESHAFPYYTKYLAELIALDQDDNQYFISTHNPYFLLPLVEKAPKDDLAVNIVYTEKYQTRVRRMDEEDLSESAEIDVFSNLERYLTKR